MKSEKFQLLVNEKTALSLHESDALELDVVELPDGHFHLIKNGVSYRAELSGIDLETKTVGLKINGSHYSVKIADHFDRLVEKMGLSKEVSHKINEIKAPMPGMVLSIAVAPGQAVVKGDTLLILEAMKMENVIKAPADCTIKSIPAAKGKAVDKGEVLMVME